MDTKAKLYTPEGASEDLTSVLEHQREPQNEYELQEQFIWEYYKQYRQQRQNPITVEEYLNNSEAREEAHDIWVNQGLDVAFRSLVNEHRPDSTEEDTTKTRPTDEPEEENLDLSSEGFVPDVSLDDVMRRRAEHQAA